MFPLGIAVAYRGLVWSASDLSPSSFLVAELVRVQTLKSNDFSYPKK
jgi:hypothetical protein